VLNYRQRGRPGRTPAILIEAPSARSPPLMPWSMFYLPSQNTLASCACSYPISFKARCHKPQSPVSNNHNQRYAASRSLLNSDHLLRHTTNSQRTKAR